MTNLLDQNPIYCVGQIIIPNGLPGLLKAFAKEAIRHNPKDIETFAWRYFEKLAAAVQLDATAPPPSINQVSTYQSQTLYLYFLRCVQLN